MSNSLESYAHKAAKAVVVSWLRGAAREVGWDQSASVAGLFWRVNRGAPCWGIWEEYPFIGDGNDCHCVWDERGWPDDRTPTRDELIKKGTPPVAIADIAVQHKGMIIYAIEIVHRHPLTDQKRDFLFRLDCTTLVVSARWVLNQVAPPSRFRVSEIINRAARVERLLVVPE